ncbi:MAG TPA: hypothetical protein VJ813_05890 [Vicinamibacterales bacterium]|nr:hypothetical protein [Vicinamibacterales bacterium]
MKPVKRLVILVVGAAGIFGVSLLIDTVRVVAQAGGMGPNLTIGPLPLPIIDVSGGTEPFQASGACQIAPGQVSCQQTIFHVPPGRRAVVENFSGIAEGAPIHLFLSTTIGAASVRHYLPTPNINEEFESSFGARVQVYADPSTGVTVGAQQFSGGITVLEFSISGYLVPVQQAPTQEITP